MLTTVKFAAVVRGGKEYSNFKRSAPPTLYTISIENNESTGEGEGVAAAGKEKGAGEEGVDAGESGDAEHYSICDLGYS